jgi:[ribosomal protein S5]-alanine N-acetyltransferase
LSDEEVVKFEPYDIFSENQAKDEAISRVNNEFFYAVSIKDSGS